MCVCRDMFCAGRVEEQDLKRTMQACGGAIQTTTASLTDDVLGTCSDFEEIQIGGERSVQYLFLCQSFCKWWSWKFVLLERT